MESFEDRYIKPSDVPDIIWELSAGYLLNLKEMIQELNLGEDSFQLSCYEVCFQNQWGVRGVEFYFFLLRYSSRQRKVGCHSPNVGWNQEDEEVWWVQDFVQ